MSDYTKITDFAVKDSLLTGNPLKLITGTAHDNEYNAIAVAIATKVDESGGTITNGTLVNTALGTPASGTLTNCTGLPLAGVTDSTTEALGVGSLELGHASDTTLTRVSAGVMAVEGVNVLTTATGAALAGSATQTFSVAAATADAHAVPLAQFETITTPILTLSGSTGNPTTPVTATATYAVSGKYADVEVTFSNVDTTGASGNLQITGLTNALVGNGHPGAAYLVGMGTTAAVAIVSGTTITLYGAATADGAPIPIVAGTGKYVVVHVRYRIAA